MIVDTAMARRMETALARASAAVAQARAEQDPAAHAGSQAWLGGYLVSTGRHGYVNRAIGGAIEGSATDADLREAARFFRDRGLPVEVELGPYTDGSLVTIVNTRGPRLAWSRNVLFRETTPLEVTVADIAVEMHVVTDATAPRWQRMHRLGFETSAAAQASDDHTAAAQAASGRINLLVTVDGHDVGIGSVTLLDGCAVLGGAATVPQWRGRGVQTELVCRRLQMAADAGCDLAVVEADPGTASERNLCRLGFKVAYTKTGVVLAGA